MPISVLIADDHQVYLDGLEMMLSKNSELQVVGKAANGKELVQMEKILKPDVILTDIAMPLMDGIAATKAIIQSNPLAGVIALSTYSDETLVTDAFAAGARGYLVKNADNEEILQAIKTVYKGNKFYCKQTSLTLANLISKKNSRENSIEKYHLSQKEIEVIKLLCQGRSNKEVAQILGLSVRTVEGYRKDIYKKTGENGTAGIVVFAIQHKIYVPDGGIIEDK